MKCPNCAEELERRPCQGCGWPTSTHPGQEELRKVAARQRERASDTAAEEEQQGLGRCCLWAMALISTCATYAAFQVGEGARWTSDGPGILMIYLLVAGCGVAALSAWAGLLASLLRPYTPRWIRSLLQDLFS